MRNLIQYPCLLRSCQSQVMYLALTWTTAVLQAVRNLKRRLFLGCQGICHYQFMLVQSKVMPDRDFFQELEILWEHAIDKWLRVFEILGYPRLLGELLSLELQQPEGGRARPIIRDAMGIKSPRTAIKRALAVL